MTEEFFILKPIDMRFGNKFAYGEQLSPVKTGPFPECPVCMSPVGGRSWLAPRRVKISSSKESKWGDFLWGDGFTLAVTEKIRQRYGENKLNGIASFLILDIVKVGRKELSALRHILPKFYLIEIFWNGANLDDNASNVVRQNVRCSFCRSGRLISLDSIRIEKNSWNGDDIFKLRGLPGEIVVTRKFRNLVDEHNSSGVQFIPVENFFYKDTIGWSVR